MMHFIVTGGAGFIGSHVTEQLLAASHSVTVVDNHGKQIRLPISESQDTCPISPYGLQKLVSEQYGGLFAKKLGFSFVALRMFNVFGPRQVPSSQYSGVISIFVAAMQQGLPITIYGNGTQTRDFIYVLDVAIAFAKTLTTTLASGECLTCNLGTVKSTSLVQLVESLKPYLTQWKSETRFASPRPGDIQHSQADISKISALLGFTPQSCV